MPVAYKQNDERVQCSAAAAAVARWDVSTHHGKVGRGGLTGAEHSEHYNIKPYLLMTKLDYLRDKRISTSHPRLTHQF